MPRHSLEVRREEILRATVAEITARGLANVRVSDVAGRLGVSNALVFYHFASKEKLISAAYEFAAKRDLHALAEIAAAGGSATDRLGAILAFYLPTTNSSTSWELWIDAWGAALRSEEMRRTSRAIDRKWKQEVARVIGAGVDDGEFDCPDPQASAWRLTALIDGLAIQLVANRNGVRRKDVLGWVARAATDEVGVPVIPLR